MIVDKASHAENDVLWYIFSVRRPECKENVCAIITCLMMFCPVMLCNIVDVALAGVLTIGLEVTTVGAVTEMVPGAVTVIVGRGTLEASCVFTGIVTT